MVESLYTKQLIRYCHDLCLVYQALNKQLFGQWHLASPHLHRRIICTNSTLRYCKLSNSDDNFSAAKCSKWPKMIENSEPIAVYPKFMARTLMH